MHRIQKKRLVSLLLSLACRAVVPALGYCIRWPFRWSVKPALPQVTAVAVAIAADRGHLRYDEPIADIWPEFAQVCWLALPRQATLYYVSIASL